jgi:RNA polymerase sigma-70 factor (ECF subfamily)
LKIFRLPPPPAARGQTEEVYRVLLQSLDALYRTAKRLTGRADVAEDLVQDTARKALEGMPALKDDRNIQAWLFRILMNAIRDQARRKKLWVEVEASGEPADFTALSEEVALATAEDIRRAIAILTPETQAVALLIDLEEFTIAETAGILQIPPGTVASRLSRARRELRKALRSYASKSSRRGGRS